MSEPRLPVLSDRAMAVDAAAIAVVSAAILSIPNRVALMSALVALVFLLRMWAWWRLPLAERGPLASEAVFLAVCTLIGGFNDWNSVVRHDIYDYRVAVWWPELSTIPLWMLAFWGLILRSLFSLSRWHRLDPPADVHSTVAIGQRRWHSPPAKVAALLLLTFATRQCIYGFWADPWLSWLPFVAALLAYNLLFRPGVHDRRLVAVIVVVGPVIEGLYIGVGGLHHYALGWLAGVPLWIALWWLLAVLVWKDLGARLWLACRSLERRGLPEAPSARKTSFSSLTPKLRRPWRRASGWRRPRVSRLFHSAVSAETVGNSLELRRFRRTCAACGRGTQTCMSRRSLAPVSPRQRSPSRPRRP